MRGAIIVVTVLFGALLQVSVAPLFPLTGAIPEVGVLVLVLILLGFGGRSAMVATPLLALFLGLAGNRAPGLVVIAYLPVVPLGLFAEDLNAPLGRYLRIIAVVLGAGTWARLVLAGGAIASGAPFEATVLIRDLIIPGVLFDFVLGSLCYIPCRLAGWTDRPLNLQRRGWL